jgi:AcrR family transcriptional regulator
VLRVVRRQYLDGERVDLTVVSRELGLSRATIYRWFGSRDALLGEVIADELERLVERERRGVRRRGAAGLLAVFDGINQALARSSAVRRLLEQERNGAMRLLTASTGVVQPRAVELVRELIDAEVASGTYEPPADTTT